VPCMSRQEASQRSGGGRALLGCWGAARSRARPRRSIACKGSGRVTAPLARPAQPRCTRAWRRWWSSGAPRWRAAGSCSTATAAAWPARCSRCTRAACRGPSRSRAWRPRCGGGRLWRTLRLHCLACDLLPRSGVAPTSDGMMRASIHEQTHPGAGHECPQHVCLEVIRQAHASRADIVSACQCLLQKRVSSVRAARHPRAAGLAAARHAGRVCGHDGAAGAGPGAGAVRAGCTWTSAVRRFEECVVAVGTQQLACRLAADCTDTARR